MARPTKLSPELQAKIVQAIRAGAYMETAAAFAGVHRDTLHDWLRRGERARGTRKDRAYQEFSDAVERALAEAEIKDIAIVDQAARRDWKAAAWKLERRNPQRWGRRQILEHQGGGEDAPPVRIEAHGDPVPAIPVPVDEAELADPAAKALAAALKRLRDTPRVELDARAAAANEVAWWRFQLSMPPAQRLPYPGRDPSEAGAE